MEATEETLGDSELVTRVQNLMSQIKQLLDQWESETMKLRQFTPKLCQELEEFIAIVRNVRLPKKFAFSPRRNSSAQVEGPHDNDVRSYSKILIPPPKDITEKRNSVKKLNKGRRQTVGGISPLSPTDRNKSLSSLASLASTPPHSKKPAESKETIKQETNKKETDLVISMTSPVAEKSKKKKPKRSKNEKTGKRKTREKSLDLAQDLHGLSSVNGNDLTAALEVLDSFASGQEMQPRTKRTQSDIPWDLADIVVDSDLAMQNPAPERTKKRHEKKKHKKETKSSGKKDKPVPANESPLYDAVEGTLPSFDLSGLDSGLLDMGQVSFAPAQLPDLSALDVSGLDANLSNVGKLQGSSTPTSESKPFETPKENSKIEAIAPMSYDDFMAALTAPPPQSKVAAVPVANPGALVRAIGAREDMNRKGMKRIKKRSITTGKKKGVYQMEDVHYIGYPFQGNENIALLSVLDGHAEKEAAETAKQVLPDIFAELLKKGKLTDAGADRLLHDLFLQTDEKLLPYETEGTTATVSLFWKYKGKRYLQCANVGDSTAFLCRDGQAIPLSVDHKVDNPAEIERMKQAGMVINKAQNRINGLALSRTLGDHFIKMNFPGVIAEPYVSPIYQLKKNDSLFILASDGLWDVMNGQQAYEMVKDYQDPQDMASKLLTHALHSGRCTDNITVIVVTL